MGFARGVLVCLAAVLAMASCQPGIPMLNPGGNINGDINRGPVLNDQYTAPIVDANAGFRAGRSTFFDGTPAFKEAYVSRGAGSFGDILYGSCGYFNQRDGSPGPDYQDLPFNIYNVGATANINPDYPGTCGRCYEIRCIDGVVYGNGSTPISTTDFFYLASVNSSVLDEQGRRFPGNPLEAQQEQFVRCWNASDNGGVTPSVIIHTIDSCPAIQVKNGVEVPQLWCNSDIAHFDLSYWAFQTLAHPTYGVMSTEFRPVDCYTGAPMTFTPGYINKTLYGDQVETGWSWQPYYLHSSQFFARGRGLGGSNATCVNLATKAAYGQSGSGGGGLTMTCRNCSQAGYQPFAGATTLTFSIRSNSTGPGDERQAATPAGGIPSISVGLSQAGTSRYCDANPQTSGSGALTPSSTSKTPDGGTYYTYRVPISAFSCTSLPLSQVDTLGFSSLSELDYASFCLDGISIS